MRFSLLAVLLIACRTSDKKAAVPITPLDDHQIAGVSQSLISGQLAASQQASPHLATAQVKAYAQTVNTSASSAQQQQTALGVSTSESSVSDTIDKSNAAVLQQLTGALGGTANTGPDTNGSVCTNQEKTYDCVYMQTQVQLHQDAIDQLDSELLPQVRDAQLKAFLVGMRGDVQTHLAQAQAFAIDGNSTVGTSVGGSGGTTTGGTTGTSTGATTGTTSGGASSGTSSGVTSGSSSGDTSGSTSGGDPVFSSSAGQGSTSSAGSSSGDPVFPG